MLHRIKWLKHQLRLHLNIPKTLYINFKVFPFQTAIHLPVFLYGDIQLENLHKGCIHIATPTLGGVRIGGGWHTEMFGFSKLYKSLVRIEGHITFGSDITICQGCVISISKGAELIIGNHVKMNVNVKIHSKEKITIGDSCRIGWDSQILDTSFHYTLNNGMISYRHAPVCLSHHTWLANGVHVMKGTVLPAYSVVGSKSLVNRNMMEYGEKCLFAGTPAKYIHNNIERLFDKEKILDSCFSKGQHVISYDEVKELLG